MTNTQQNTAEPLLTVEHLTMRFGGLVAIDDVSFTAENKSITAIIGPNGAGKTTVFNCLTGFYKPTEGQLGLNRNGESFLLERMEGHDISARAGVARTFQNIRLFQRMSVLENLLVAQHNQMSKVVGPRDRRDGGPLAAVGRTWKNTWYSVFGLFNAGGFRQAEADAIDKAKFWIDRIGLTDRADWDAGNLPYGDQRRLEIARAMCTEPCMLCLDEPAAGLNPRESGDLNQLILSLRDDHGIGVLLIEHDMSVVMSISDHVIVLDYGRKISDGTPEFVRNDPAVIRAYLGAEEEEDIPDVVAEDIASHAEGEPA